MIPQSTFMITAKIAAGQEDSLRKLLASMNQRPGLADPRNSLVPFYQFLRLHVARFVIIEANTDIDLQAYGIEPSNWPLTLAFLGDIDGPEDIFLAEMAVRAGEGLQQIFSHCDGFVIGQTDLLDWMKRCSTRPTANYTNWLGRTVGQIHEEHALSKVLRVRLEQILSEQVDVPAEAMRLQLIEFVESEVASLRLRLTPSSPTPPGWFIANTAHLIALPAALVALAPAIAVAAPFFFWRLRVLENSDPENLLKPERDHVSKLATQEDWDVTNQFNVFGQIKPGIFRRKTMRVLLLLLNYAARHIYNRGYLTRIQTIHFARWVLLDNGKRVYFASNYDGSADSYMDDFINKVAWGLNLVFSNGVGYPKTRWLIKGGAEYEEKYKRTLRRSQLRSECWYKAYPGLTAADLARNHRIRQGLEAKTPSSKEVREWLSML